MQIVLVLLFLAAVAVLALSGTLTISLLVGVLLSRFPKAKPIAPVFVSIIPAGAIGALAGGVGIGYIAVRYDEHLVFLGPLGGIIIGGLIGLIVGTGLAGTWWYRRKRAQQNSPANAEKLPR
ncbi:MAG TPA: hypothetical protein VK568_08410 [Thermodesulfobacteriota bacterium]|jgi:hypothetical protein|nr:hypothetical protein [Thermodesulfobacteriota bacterium]